MRPGFLGGLFGGGRRGSRTEVAAPQAPPRRDGAVDAAERQLSLKAAQAREEERRRVAVDLHDGPVQQIVNLVLRIDMAERTLPEGAEETRTEYAALRQFARDILSDMRRFMFELRPASLDEFALLPVLRQYIQDFRKEYSIEVELDLQDADWHLGRDVEINLFRVIQEALTNVRKHAKASRVDLRLRRTAATVTVDVIDTGRGFDVGAARLQAHHDKKLGLTSMEDRARALGGSLTLESSAQGTSVRVSIPLANEKAAVTYGSDSRPDRR